jgi:hypothetical protein
MLSLLSIRSGVRECGDLADALAGEHLAALHAGWMSERTTPSAIVVM